MHGQPAEGAAELRPILPPEHRRNLVDTYLTYPEWSIVHAYEDFAGVRRSAANPGSATVDSIRGYWRNLCGCPAIASARDGSRAT